MTPLEHQKIDKLIGQKCEINCSLDGTESKVLLDTGAQVSLISRHFLHKFLPNLQIQPMKDLSGEQTLELYIVNNSLIQFDGFVEITFAFLSKDEDFCIKVPFLVTSEDIDKTIIGFNVIFELIQRCNSQETNQLFLKTLTSSFVSAKEYDVKSFVNLVQESRGGDLCDVKTIKKDFVVPKGMSLRVPCRVSPGPVTKSTPVIFEPYQYETGDLPNGLQLQQTLLRISPQTTRVHLTVFNNTDHDIFLQNRTALGRLELIRSVIPLEVKHKGFPNKEFSEQSKTDVSQVSSVIHEAKKEMNENHNIDQNEYEQILTRIDLTNLTPDQAEKARTMLSEEIDSFSKDDHDVGQAEELQMKINLTEVV